MCRRFAVNLAPWFFRAIIRRFVLNRVYDDMDLLHDALPRLAADAGITYTVVMPYNLKNWASQRE